MQCLLELLLLLQISENLPADSLQALHLPLALVHLPFQGLHTQRQLGTEKERGRGTGVRGEQRRSQVKTWTRRGGWSGGDEARQKRVKSRGSDTCVGLYGSSFVKKKKRAKAAER